MAEGTIMQWLLGQIRTAETSLIGGTAYFYAIGGTTPKAAYSDMAATTPIYSVLLDADGTAEVYGTGKYRILIKDADGVTQFDRDVNFWGWSGYVTSPATNTAAGVPQWAGTNTLTLIDGLTLKTTLASPGVDTAIATEKATRTALTALVTTATATTEGVIELATNDEALTGTDAGRAITPANLNYTLDNTPHVLQVVNYSSGVVATGAGIIPWDTSIPQKTEGTEWATLAITPKSATSKLIIGVLLNWSSGGEKIIIALFQDDTAGALSAVADYRYAGYAGVTTLKHFMTSATTSSTTFKVRFGPDATSTVTINGSASAAKLGGVNISSITITEVLV
jgi:hypothetical protein